MRRRGRCCRSSTDSSEDDRADASPSRSRHALGGAHTGSSSWILTARLVLGRRGLLQGMSLASLERVVVRLDLRVWRMLTAPLPSRGFAWREVAWGAFQSPMASSRRSGSSPVLLVSRFWAGFFHPLLGAPLLGRLSVVPAAGLTAVSLAYGLAFGGLPCGGGLPRGY